MEHNKIHTEAVKIFFDLDDTGWKWTEESMWALPMDSYGMFKLDNIPLLAYGISRGDIFSAELSVEKIYQFKEIVERGGHSTVRVHFRMDPLDLHVVSRYMNQLKELGCEYEGNGATLYGVDIPSSCNFMKIMDVLKAAEELGVWEYEEGYIHS